MPKDRHHCTRGNLVKLLLIQILYRPLTVLLRNGGRLNSYRLAVDLNTR